MPTVPYEPGQPCPNCKHPLEEHKSRPYPIGPRCEHAIKHGPMNICGCDAALLITFTRKCDHLESKRVNPEHARGEGLEDLYECTACGSKWREPCVCGPGDREGNRSR